jgi:glyoxylase-like metal-dependent hydrolase (beta-lactamase superfamily II)
MTERLADGVWRLEVGGVSVWNVNAYLVDDGGTLTLVDAGTPFYRETLPTAVAAAGHELADVERVLVTHYDLDHFGGLLRGNGLDATVYAGGVDADLLAGDHSPPLLHHKGAFHRAVAAVLDDREVERVEDGDTVGGFTAYHTPGHNPGHMAYHHPDHDAAFLGDLVWERDGALTTPIRLDSYDLAELRESVVDLADRLPPFALACMGHGTPLTTGGSDRLRELADALA